MDASLVTKELQETWERTIAQAQTMKASLITPELFLFCLLEDSHARAVLEASNVEIQDFGTELMFLALEDAMDEQIPDSYTGGRPFADEKIGNILERAYLAIQRSGEDRLVDGIDVMMAFYPEKDCPAAKLLQKRLDRIDAIMLAKKVESQGLRWTESGKKSTANTNNNVPATNQRPAAPAQTPAKGKKKMGEALNLYCVDLMEKATDGKIDPLIGRDTELERTVQVLSRRSKNNPLYVGEPGVGKTAIAEGLARNIFEGSVPEDMENDYVLTLDMGALVAGTKYRGEFEERLKNVLKELKEFEDLLVQDYHVQQNSRGNQLASAAGRPPKVHLFIDEIHTLVGAGAASGGSMDASNLLKPALANGELSCIGATTYDEYRKAFSKDKALVRRFQKIDVREPTVDETFEILKGLRSRFENHHGVTYTDEALQKAASLAKRYVTERKLPDSAIDLVDEAGANQKSKPRAERKTEIGTEDIETVVSTIARIPPARVSEDDKNMLKSLADDMKKAIFGQDQAIDKLSSAVKLARAGMREPEKPIGSYLFAGPTGVGKTEVTKQLAEQLGLELVRIDMSEYMEKHTVSRLLGAPPGYVGYDQDGLLTGPVSKHPHCVLLLDEIEKAHPDIYNILLQVMDNGRLTDSSGKNVDFRNVILIMTTNAGATEKAKPGIGFMADDNKGVGENQAIARTFSPEFRNRLDDVVSFDNLKPEHMGAIVDKFVGQLENQLRDRNVTITLDQKAREWIAKKGYDEAMGARPMGRVIQEYIKKPLSEEILFGALQKGGNVHILFNDESAGKDAESTGPLRFEFNAASGAEAPEQKQEAKRLPAPQHR